MHNSVAVTASETPEVEVPEKPRRRRFTADYKLTVLREADGCTGPGAVGALLRREGLYSSHLTTWRTPSRFQVTFVTARKWAD